MSTIITLNQNDSGSTARTSLNTNFSNLNTDKAETASPVFTGTVVLPSTTSIGNVSATELGYVDGVTSAIQTQLDAKAALASPTFSGTPSLPTGTTGVTQSVGDSSTKLATTAFVAGELPVIETTTGVTHSLTTVASQKVVVWATGQVDMNSGESPTITLAYNAVAKHAIQVNGDTNTADKQNFSLMYTETPGAATQNITVTQSGGQSVSNVVIIVMKL